MEKFIITAIQKDGLRHMATDNNKYHTYDTRELAQKQLDAILTINPPELIIETMGRHLRVDPVECYPGGDAMRTVFYTEAEEIIPEQTTLFLQEWLAADFIKMKQAIVRHFTHNPISISGEVPRMLYKPAFGMVDKILGLAYTSSSSCAMYSVCNVDLRYSDTLRYVYFAIGQDGMCYAELWDNDEKPTIILLN